MSDAKSNVEIDPAIEQQVTAIMRKKAAERSRNFDRALFGTAGIFATSMAAGFTLVAAAMYVPLSHERDLLIEEFDTARQVATLSGGKEFSLWGDSIIGPGEYTCKIWRPMASNTFPFASYVPSFLEGISGCEVQVDAPAKDAGPE